MLIFLQAVQRKQNDPFGAQQTSMSCTLIYTKSFRASYNLYIQMIGNQHTSIEFLPNLDKQESRRLTVQVIYPNDQESTHTQTSSFSPIWTNKNLCRRLSKYAGVQIVKISTTPKTN